MANFNLRPGDRILRKSLHATFGGKPQGGVSPSRKSNVIFLFSGPEGAQFGYHDRWVTIEGKQRYLFLGEGQLGDQQVAYGNRAIQDHEIESRDLHVFQGASGEVEYSGQFRVDPATPLVWLSGPDAEGQARLMIGHVLMPVGEVPHPDAGHVESLDEVVVTETDLESIDTIVFESSTPGTITEKVRREAMLVSRFRAWLRRQGHQAIRHRIVPPGSGAPMFTDIFDPEDGILWEAKGSGSRQDVRMALGQLIDYLRFVEASKAGVLLPAKPGEDLTQLVLGANRYLAYEAAEGVFEVLAPETQN